MPKLYFRYGTMNSSKTSNLLMTAHNYVSQYKRVFLIKPEIDTRTDKNEISSRIVPGVNADYIMPSSSTNVPDIEADVQCVLVDEAQFLSAKNVDCLRELTNSYPVICYGLRTDYRSLLFEGSKRLLEVADTIEEIKMICTRCNKKAIFNAKTVDNVVVKSGSGDIDLGGEEKYAAMCWACWAKK